MTQRTVTRNQYRGLKMEWVAWGAALLVPILVTAILVAVPDFDPVYQLPAQHFYIVSTVSLISLAFSTIVLIAAARSANRRMELMAFGFLALAGIFAVHGLATPGFILASPTPSVGVSSRLAFLAAGALFALSALNFRGSLGRWVARNFRLIEWLVPALIVLYIVVGLALPDLLAFIPVTSAPLSVLTTLIGLLLFGYAVVRAIDDYTLARLPLQSSIVFGLILLADALLILHMTELFRLSWWGYHVVMLVGFLLLLGGLTLEFSRGGGIVEIFGGTFVQDPKVSLERGYTEGMRAMITAIEVKHAYTRGHADRVTEIALRIAQEMGLPPERQRIVAFGGILHDIGKIGIPDAILNKPGRLTDDEFAEIKKHPVLSDEMVSQIRSLRVAREVVRHHHEWINGRSYPDGVTGDQLTLEAKIIAVADVFEALTARRSYRDAFDRQAAYDILRSKAGTHLDPEVVAVWLRIADTWTRAPRHA